MATFSQGLDVGSWQISSSLVWLLWSDIQMSHFWICQWFRFSCLASILSPLLGTNSLATQYGSRVGSAWSFVSGSGEGYSAGPWILHHHVLRAHLGFQSTSEWLLVVILCTWEAIQDCFLYKPRVGSQAVSLWRSLSWWPGAGRKWVAWMHSTSDSVADRS